MAAGAAAKKSAHEELWHALRARQSSLTSSVHLQTLLHICTHCLCWWQLLEGTTGHCTGAKTVKGAQESRSRSTTVFNIVSLSFLVLNPTRCVVLLCLLHWCAGAAACDRQGAPQAQGAGAGHRSHAAHTTARQAAGFIWCPADRLVVLPSSVPSRSKRCSRSPQEMAVAHRAAGPEHCSRHTDAAERQKLLFARHNTHSTTQLILLSHLKSSSSELIVVTKL